MAASDVHVHVGYYPRLGRAEPFYFSPRRVFGILDHAGVGEFVFSSTNAIWDFDGETMHREAREMLRLAGSRAHAFFWVTDEHLKRDPDLKKLPDFYEGLKLHGGETPWTEHPRQLARILSIARERRFAVQIHTGKNGDTRPNPISAYLPFCRRFPEIKFDLAHGDPANEVPRAVNDNDNVYVDSAYCDIAVVRGWLDAGARPERILFGSDLPVQQRHFDISLTAYMRKQVKKYSELLHTDLREFMGK